MSQLMLESDQFYLTHCGQILFVIECPHHTPRMFMARFDKDIILFQEDGTRWPTHLHHGSDLVGKQETKPSVDPVIPVHDYHCLVESFYQMQVVNPKKQHLKTLLIDFSKFILSKGHLHEQR